MSNLSLTEAGNRTSRAKVPAPLGVKLIVVCMLALFMTIPSFFVSAADFQSTSGPNALERSPKDISANVGGQQVFLGPTLANSLSDSRLSRLPDTEHHGTYLVFHLRRPQAPIKTTTEEHGIVPSSASLSFRLI